MTQPNEVVTRRDQLATSGPVFRDFTARLVSMEFPIENGRPKSKLQFVDMDVHKAIAAYPHPTGEIVMNRTGRNGAQPSDRSPWGRLIISSDEQGYPDIMELEGKVLHMVASENAIEADPATNREAGTFITWAIHSVDGIDNRVQPGEEASDSAEDD